VKRPRDGRPVSLLPPNAAALLHRVRENLRLRGELVARDEIGRLEASPDGPQVRSPADLVAYLGPELAGLAQGQLRVVRRDTKNRLLGVSLVYQGGLNATMIRLADCFREAVRASAAGVIFCHNHPSGDPSPSPEDVRLTAEAAKVADLLGIELLDHVIVGRQAHVSLRERGLSSPNEPQPS
jgi:DNA repair protein RadC